MIESSAIWKEIRIIPSSTQLGDANCLLKPNSSCEWESDNEENSSLEFIFLNGRFKLLGYSITPHVHYCPFNEWVIEGSNNGCGYSTIHLITKEDNVKMCTEINNQNACLQDKPYSTDIINNLAFQYIKLKALNSRICDGGSGFHILYLSHIDLYGMYLNPRKATVYYYYHHFIVFMSILMINNFI